MSSLVLHLTIQSAVQEYFYNGISRINWKELIYQMIIFDNVRSLNGTSIIYEVVWKVSTTHEITFDNDWKYDEKNTIFSERISIK